MNLGGEIHINSTEGEGSQFYFDVPAWASPRTEIEFIENADEGKEVIICSLNQVYPKILSNYLHNSGFKTNLVQSKDALEKALQTALSDDKPVRVVADHSSSQIMAELLREHLEFSSTPILFICSNSSEVLSDHEKTSYLQSPISGRELMQCLNSSSIPGLAAVTAGAAAPSADAAKLAVPAVTTISSLPQILIAEDSPVLQSLVKQLMKKLAYNAEIVSNGREVVEQAGKKNYSLILMDWQMPQLDGLEATKVIRVNELGSGKHVPIIAMTANAMHGDKERCLSAGMDGYMSKPFNLDQLKAVIEKYSKPPDSD